MTVLGLLGERGRWPPVWLGMDMLIGPSGEAAGWGIRTAWDVLWPHLDPAHLLGSWLLPPPQLSGLAVGPRGRGRSMEWGWESEVGWTLGKNGGCRAGGWGRRGGRGRRLQGLGFPGLPLRRQPPPPALLTRI